MAQFCTNCGSRNEDNLAFCEQCGHSLTTKGRNPPLPTNSHAAQTPPRTTYGIHQIRTLLSNRSLRAVVAIAGGCALLYLAGIIMSGSADNPIQLGTSKVEIDHYLERHTDLSWYGFDVFGSSLKFNQGKLVFYDVTVPGATIDQARRRLSSECGDNWRPDYYGIWLNGSLAISSQSDTAMCVIQRNNSGETEVIAYWKKDFDLIISQY